MRLRAEQAAEKVEETKVRIKKGQLIVDKGEIISREDFVLLDGFGLSRRQINWRGLGLSVIVVGSVVGVFCFIIWRLHRTDALKRPDFTLLVECQCAAAGSFSDSLY